jgi:hypothetical protein
LNFTGSVGFMTGVGAFTATFKQGPQVIYKHNFTNMSIAGSNVGATAYSCTEGTFGGNVGANICANTTFGDDFINDTTATYVGNTYSRVVGGDDAIATGTYGAMTSYDSLDGLYFAGYNPITKVVTLSNIGAGLYDTDLTNAQNDGTNGYTLAIQDTTPAVPVPAAAWLMGSGLVGLAGIARRRKMA